MEVITKILLNFFKNLKDFKKCVGFVYLLFLLNLTTSSIEMLFNKTISIIPILRNPADLTDLELKEINMNKSDIDEFILQKGIGLLPAEFIKVLKMQVDIFGLIESGQAIDKKKLQTKDL